MMQYLLILLKEQVLIISQAYKHAFSAFEKTEFHGMYVIMFLTSFRSMKFLSNNLKLISFMTDFRKFTPLANFQPKQTRP